MAGQEFKARDRKVQKMTKEGLTEENLYDGTKKKITQKTKEEIPKIRSPEYNIHRELKRDDRTDITSTSKRNRKYQSNLKNEIGDRVKPSEKAAFLRSEEEKPETGKRRRQQYHGEKEVMETQKEDVDGVSDTESVVHSSSGRMDAVRNRSAGAGKSYIRGAVDSSHLRKKKLVQKEARKRNVTETAKDMEDFREDIDKKVKREQTVKAQKKAGRLSFDDAGGMVKGQGTGVRRKAVSTVAGSASTLAHGKVYEVEDGNSAVEGAHQGEILAEHASRSLRNVQERRMKKATVSVQFGEKESDVAGVRLRFGEGSVSKEAQKVTNHTAQAEAAKKARIRRFWQKKKYKDAYVAAKEGKKLKDGVKVAETITFKAKALAKEIFRRNSGILIGLGIFVLLFGILASSLTSCSAGIQGFSSAFVGTTYPSTDTNIYATENAYVALEEALNEQINSVESRHTGYDEYRYQIDEISHNPYHLISYFTVKYGQFTYQQIKDELEEIFREQYTMTTQSQRETVTETKTVRVGESLGQVVTSGYCNCTICCGQWSGGPTASGAMPTSNHTIAVDANNPFVPMGTKVVMNGVEYTVEDTGNFARYGVQFDVYYGSHSEASAHGHQTWDAYIADSNGSQEVEVTTTTDVNRLNVTMTNHNLDTVLRNRMNADEIKRYDLYNFQYGNRDYLFDVNTLPNGGGAGGDFGYQIPSEALTDEKFAKMIREAEKYLGYPYVWGGASPSTSFDCSGFVSWVINNCGNGWSIGRQTADGLRGCCAQVSPSQAKPGDLIFFQGTYDTPGASHVGIYVGNGMMIHCGSPIQYTSIETSYWQQHFMAYGRLP